MIPNVALANLERGKENTIARAHRLAEDADGVTTTAAATVGRPRRPERSSRRREQKSELAAGEGDGDRERCACVRRLGGERRGAKKETTAAARGIGQLPPQRAASRIRRWPTRSPFPQLDENLAVLRYVRAYRTASRFKNNEIRASFRSVAARVRGRRYGVASSAPTPAPARGAAAGRPLGSGGVAPIDLGVGDRTFEAAADRRNADARRRRRDRRFRPIRGPRSCALDVAMKAAYRQHVAPAQLGKYRPVPYRPVPRHRRTDEPPKFISRLFANGLRVSKFANLSRAAAPSRLVFSKSLRIFNFDLVTRPAGLFSNRSSRSETETKRFDSRSAKRSTQIRYDT
ncbi:hypothetical protein V9T40_013184 [Parthenolecanium corni]|uniref:Uncharacterized protein n=1 Tax=Parthenolecanium corni TaxID=536013 RepID=A0AAN9TWS2_9HEMI